MGQRETNEQKSEQAHRIVSEIAVKGVSVRQPLKEEKTELFTQAQKIQIQIEAIKEVSGKS